MDYTLEFWMERVNDILLQQTGGDMGYYPECDFEAAYYRNWSPELAARSAIDGGFEDIFLIDQAGEEFFDIGF